MLLIYLRWGFHHSKRTIKDGTLGQSDDGLIKDINWMVSNLEKFCGNMVCKFCKMLQCWKCSCLSVWEKMKYKHEVIELTTKKFKDSHELTEHSINKLRGLARRICNKAGPSTFVFYSCYSYYSMVSQLIRAKGIISVAYLVKDLLDITDRKVCQLDEQQIWVIKSVNEVLLDSCWTKYENTYLWSLSYCIFRVWKKKMEPPKIFSYGDLLVLVKLCFWWRYWRYIWHFTIWRKRGQKFS